MSQNNKFSIPQSFRKDNEDYLTMLPIRKFMNENGLGYPTNRDEAILGIENFANQNEENEQRVKSFLDETLKEGIKHVYLYKYKEIEIENFTEKAEELLCEEGNNSLLDGPESHEYVLKKYKINKTGEHYSLYFMRTILNDDKDKIKYPIFVDIYTNNNLIAFRGKSSSKLIEYNGVIPEDEYIKKTDILKQINKVKKIIRNTFGLTLYKQCDIENLFESNLYKLLLKYTKTPEKIEQLLTKNSELIDNVTEETKKIIGEFKIEPDIEYIRMDYRNILEKHLSINEQDKTIFTKDRDMYPISLSATDDEESEVKQISRGLQDPLQSKSVFFDNKRILEISEQCYSVTFMSVRKNSKYSGEYYSVSYLVKDNYCRLNFTSYTMEEDIQDAINKFIEVK